MSKPVKRVDLSQLTPDERAAFIDFYKEAQKVGGGLEEVKATAATVFMEWLRSPQWRIVQADGEPPQEGWHVGAPELNIIDERPQT